MHTHEYFAQHQGEQYCWWHLPLSENDKESAGVDMQTHDRILNEFAKTRAMQREPINFSGIHFPRSPLEYVRYHDIEELILHDVSIDVGLSVHNQFKLNSVDIARTLIRGTLSLATPMPNGAAIHECKILGSLEISYLVGGPVRISSSIVRGNLTVTGHQHESLQKLTLERSIVAGSLSVPEAITVPNVVFTDCRIRKQVTVRAKLAAIELLMDSVIARSKADLSSQLPASRIEISASKLVDLHVHRAWASLFIRSQSEVTNLAFHSATIANWSSTDCSFGRCNSENVRVEALDIVGCEFASDANLSSSQFGTFRCQANFHAPLNLRNSRFITQLRFDEPSAIARLDMGCSESAATNLPLTIFEGVTFGSARFNGRQFADAASFRRVKFENAPSFFGCSFQESFEFPMSLSCYDTSTSLDEAKYRCLRQEMERLRARAYEGLFFALEQKSARKSLNSKVDRVASWIYGVTSTYGTNLARALSSLLLVFVTFLIGYTFMLAATNSSEGITHELSMAVHMSLRQTFLPFFGLRANEWGVGWYLAWVAQSALSLAIIAEILVIIRWRFRRG